MGDVADAGLELPEARERVLPHFRRTVARANPQDGVEEGAALQTKRPGTGAMSPQEDEAAHALVFSRECLAPCAEDGLDGFVLVWFLDGMIKERVADEVILALVVATYEGDGQGQDAGACVRTWIVRPGEVASRIVPDAQVPVEAVPRFLRQVGQNGGNADFYRLAGAVDVLPAEEIVFVNDGPARQPLRAEDKIEGFADRRLSDVVAANKQRVPAAEADGAVERAAKILNGDTAHSHFGLVAIRVDVSRAQPRKPAPAVTEPPVPSEQTTSRDKGQGSPRGDVATRQQLERAWFSRLRDDIASRPAEHANQPQLPILLTADESADLLRTTGRGI